ncbi:hypothetical protein ACJIZ3_022334 [Penstemon smallii]|uniref:J domain-containing protein n=1 Tax=Penstemon smallii TaxID=265156 RepID=A0ABD3TMT2_9LAMI
MECNRDEALRAKTIAEEKLEKKDFAGAKKFAMKAQALYPELDGISHFLTALDVYISAENKISGEIDWYGVLSVTPSTDDDTIKKQYRKLALSLHPDKNKSIGADGAFKLISEAWSLLSDKAKRLSYNQRRGAGVFRGPVHTAGPSAQSRTNGSYNFTSRTTTSVPKTQTNTAKVPSKPTPTPTPTPTPSHKRTDTFWTICHRCKMHYEYLKMYLNSTLLCVNCKKAFMAEETSSPHNNSKSPSQVPRPQQQAPREHVPNPGRNIPVPPKPGQGQSGPSSAKSANFQKVPLSGTGSASVGSLDPSIAAKAASVVHQAQDKLKRAYTESNSSGNWEEYLKKIKVDHDNSRSGMNHNMAQGNGGFGTASASAPGSRTHGFSGGFGTASVAAPRSRAHGFSGGFGTASASAPGSKIHGFSGTYRQPNSTRDLTPLETRNMLMAMARKDILSKLEMWKSERTTKAVDKEKDNTKENKKERILATKETDKKEKGQVSADDASNSDPPEEVMNVPDPDFHDFDLDRSENSFGDNEVWSAYDDNDGMPRFYALISKVISTEPFRLRVSWINSKTTTEFSSMEWVGSGFYKTCGEFRVGKYVNCKSINSFSQKVNWSKNQRGSILIFPQKGDVWALYTNWSPDWNESTPEDVVHKYDMVTVLDDYNEEQGISVAPLVKVIGFKTVFRPNSENPEMIKRIPKEEMFRFSHRVPHHLLTGQEGENAPKGCLELDPAATPLELLQVITEDNEVPVVDTAEKSPSPT